MTLTPSCLDKRLRQSVRLELVLLDKSQISCIFCSMAHGNPGGTNILIRAHLREAISEMKQSNDQIKKQKGHIEANAKFKFSVFFSVLSEKLQAQQTADDRNRWHRLLVKTLFHQNSAFKSACNFNYEVYISTLE